MLTGRKIIVGVTGGIAAYKSCELVRRLVSLNAEVVVIMTPSAQKFVTPLTFEALSRNEVVTEMFPADKFVSTRHIDLAAWPDLFVIAPASANIIGKVKGGIADDMLSTVLISTTKPVLFAPAMNVHMYENRIVQENIRSLANQGYMFMEPDSGDLACRDVGKGRLPEPLVIVEEILKVLKIKLDFKGVRILVTAGGTQEPIDPVRVISNRSSGKMGYALAMNARSRGGEVTFITGANSLGGTNGLRTESAITAGEMLKAVKNHFQRTDVLLMTAAVSDFKPKALVSKKIKKNDGVRSLELQENTDILKEITREKGKRIVVGFSVESENQVANAKKKMREKRLDLVVINAPEAIGSDENKVTLLFPNGKTENLPKMSKSEVAEKILDVVGELVKRKR
ncbi:MAG: bifunctional phosphopantothenoylcysteine decarboxylase/phosphopantothenate--cysteine ligase CoaBC [candidate division Zixibacteria bacterium]|nr:bifunctional phosphopantothenoylcysteine decarboxylase/phosphopantothenate--cysteine ligase CoaBC [candidate division Zixibacteria bacterium]